jgi:predicted Zn-dependent protease
LEKALAGHDASDATLSLAASVARRAPNIPKARFYYGRLLLARQKAAEAVVELEAAVRQDPSRSSARLNLGTAYLSLGRGLDATRQFQAVLAADPENAIAAERLRAAAAPLRAGAP